MREQVQNINQKIHTISEKIYKYQDLLNDGNGKKQISKLVQEGVLLRLIRGIYCWERDWNTWNAEERHLAHVIGMQRKSEKQRIVCDLSAAIVWGLPIFNFRKSKVHVFAENSRSTENIQRHCRDTSKIAVERFGPIKATGIVDTLLNVARFLPAPEAIGALDFGLRLLSKDQFVLLSTKAREICDARLPGSVRAIKLLQLADASSDSVIESVSRLYLLHSGFKVATQVSVEGPKNTEYRVDFEFLEKDVFGEVDGATKYFDKNLTNGMGPKEVFLQEKRREDWIRGITGKRIVRWGYNELGSREKLLGHLAKFNVFPYEP